MIGVMAGEGVTVALRLLLYLDLMAVAGLLLCARRTAPAEMSPRLIALLAGIGVVVTAAHLAASAAAMVGGDAALLDAEMLRFIALETSHGQGAAVRLLALGALAMLARSSRPAALPTVLGVVALASLAWSGHAGAGEGATGILHKASDILHLIAAAMWISTLALLLLSVARLEPAIDEIVVALRRFANTGTAVVGVLIVTGVINLAMIADLARPTALIASAYGQTLAVKVALFLAMLAFAAANRWRFTPQLEHAAGRDTRAIRMSLSLELCLGIAVVLVVALLGTLSPDA
ncbi:copper homeostasis membrane protein CopD [Sphingomonas sp.]|jgi:putative copper resistance protein D|uniref:copper homeostasis membrane protein CopD n=1 Tax=Sphingomonas sp. TaxID=28214 RepID=UPI002E0E7611|nr:copper homeostasis membrane protein CopD [Sphingomonas sp.]HEV7290491.1 copper homeostasis membrane protein CopD [Sphingomonas sp.]